MRVILRFEMEQWKMEWKSKERWIHWVESLWDMCRWKQSWREREWEGFSGF